MPDPILKMSIRGGPQLVQALRSKPLRIYQVLTTKVNALLFQLQSYIVGQKLSGQVLHRRSGKLAASIRVIPASSEGGKITGFIEGAGGASFYGRFFEEGVSHPWQIMSSKKRALRFMVGNREVFAKSVMHPQQVPRKFMSPSLEEKSAEIQSSLQQALDEAINSD